MLHSAIAWFASKSAGRQLHQFLESTNHLKEVQEQVFRRQMNLLAGSDFARKYRLNHVHNSVDFRNALPILRYDDYKSTIERLKSGDFRSLFHASVKLLMFAMTSGTTAEPKFIPVTGEFVHDYHRGWNIFGLKALLDHPDAFLRKIIQITSSGRDIQTSCGLWAGAITGLLAEKQKWIVRRHYITPLFVSAIKDPIAKMYVIARLAIGENVAFLTTANPSTTLRFAHTLETYSESLIRDLHDGDICSDLNIDSTIRTLLKNGGYLQAKRNRASELSEVFSKRGRLTPKDIWKMSFICNWTGGTLKLYLEKFPHYFGDIPVRDLGLLASEGRFSIPVADNTSAGILEITSNFFEFIPEESYGEKNPPVLLADQVKIGEKYFLIFSNAAGLCRYDIGDLVRVVDFYNQTPMIEFLNKGAHTSSLTGEKLTERQVIDAMSELSKQLGISIDSFSVQPVWSDPPYYQLTLEETVASKKNNLSECYDKCLSAVNVEYKTKRESLRLNSIQINIVPDGTFQKDDLKQLSSSSRSEQYKRKFLLTEILK